MSGFYCSILPYNIKNSSILSSILEYIAAAILDPGCPNITKGTIESQKGQKKGKKEKHSGIERVSAPALGRSRPGSDWWRATVATVATVPWRRASEEARHLACPSSRGPLTLVIEP